MTSQLRDLTNEWYPRRDSEDWVLGTVYKTEGPCYRKTGAMMLFSGLGEQLGMLSGGCLESDIQQHARRVMQSGRAITLCYDGSDEDDIAFQLGIGCGGVVFILLQPVTVENNYLCLQELHKALNQRESCLLFQLIPGSEGKVGSRFEALNREKNVVTQSGLIDDENEQWLVILINPEPHLLVVGGGVDARPMVSIAHELGWQVSLWDPRPANARRQYFLVADNIIKCPVMQLGAFAQEQKVDAAILMTHNVPLDAASLHALQSSELKYIALLGPTSRRKRVMTEAGLPDDQSFVEFAGPAGLDLGGELPESIAISILSECHAKLHNRSATSFSRIL